MPRSGDEALLRPDMLKECSHGHEHIWCGISCQVTVSPRQHIILDRKRPLEDEYCAVYSFCKISCIYDIVLLSYKY